MMGLVFKKYTKHIWKTDSILHTVKSFGNMKTLSLGRKYTSGGMHGTDLLVLVYKWICDIL